MVEVKDLKLFKQEEEVKLSSCYINGDFHISGDIRKIDDSRYYCVFSSDVTKYSDKTHNEVRTILEKGEVYQEVVPQVLKSTVNFLIWVEVKIEK